MKERVNKDLALIITENENNKSKMKHVCFMNDDDDDDGDNNIKRRRIYEIFFFLMKDPFNRTTTRIFPKNTPLKLIQTINQI